MSDSTQSDVAVAEPATEGGGSGSGTTRVGTAESGGGWCARHPRLVSALLWVLALLITGGALLWQDQTGPTYPYRETIPTSKGEVNTYFLRSENLGTPLKIIITDPVPAGISARVKYRRYTANEPWSVVEMRPGSFEFARRGEITKVQGIGAELPALKERAGKYEYFVYIADGDTQISASGDQPLYARYKGAVPTPVLLVHIVVIFLAMLFAVRTTLEALRKNGNYKWMMWTTIVTFTLGAFVLGPLVQKYAFNVWWSGIPFGGDWTDNKVVFELIAWLVAAGFNWGNRRNRWVVVGAGLVTLAVYFIPHSIFGSQYNYSTGSGRGTTG